MKQTLMRKAKKPFLSIHRLLAKVGLLVVPNHYYSNVPDPHQLESTIDEWAFASDLPGIEFDLDNQESTIENICEPYQDEYVGNPIYEEGVKGEYGPGFGYIEAQALHSVIRHKKPSKIIEIGSGLSTYLMNEAAKFNEEKDTEITCVEPFPNKQLSNLVNDNDNIEIIEEKAQTVPLSVFEELDKGDLLFIDSSHTVKPGSDVNQIYLEILPRLPDGVIIHIHDIFLPYDYSRDTLQTFFHWSETSLLRALLINNPHLEIVFCMSHLHYEKQEILKTIFPDYNPQPDDKGLTHNYLEPFENPSDEHFPSSIFIKVDK
jgi:predicted O-methyltransferase YrrM